jgi:hypothetical protein
MNVNNQKVVKEIFVENPDIHWQYANVEGKRVLDLGCGDFGNATTLTYPSTVEYFLERQASFVVGVDVSAVDTENLKNKIDINKIKVLSMSIEDSSQIIDLIVQNNIDVVKCDIEGFETALFHVPIDTFRTVEEYYVETHSNDLHNRCIEKLTECGYDIYAEINLGQTNHHPQGSCKVLFARRN